MTLDAAAACRRPPHAQGYAAADAPSPGAPPVPP